MYFDGEGHLVVTPREVQQSLSQPADFINHVWFTGTPVAFPTHAGYCQFVGFLSSRLHVHPRNIVVRGSTRFGFSISPNAEKVWVEMRPDSDLDLAIVDPDYYHYLDREMRAHERDPVSNAFRGRAFKQTISRIHSRSYYTYRFYELPDIACVRDHNAHLREVPVKECCGIARPLTAFIYRDWWSIFSRCEYDLRDLRKALAAPGFPQGGEEPRPSPLLQ